MDRRLPYILSAHQGACRQFSYSGRAVSSLRRNSGSKRMTQLHSGKFIDWKDCVRFLSSCLEVYGHLGGRLELTESDDFLVFYARSFLRSRKWSVIPLWEGDIRAL